MTAPDFAPRRDPRLRGQQLTDSYRSRRRLHIPGFLAAGVCEQLHASLVASEDWRRVFNVDERVYEVSRGDYAAMDAAKRSELEAAILARARDRFQFRFETIRVPDDAAARRAQNTLLTRFADFMNQPEQLDFFRHITGHRDIDFCDAQATCYWPGDFLTTHDDNVAGKNRRAAYVFNLTPHWRIDWGGLLLFHAPDGHVDEALTPGFNALNIFSVPQPHSVSWVTAAAAGPRLSITGWMRAHQDL